MILETKTTMIISQLFAGCSPTHCIFISTQHVCLMHILSIRTHDGSNTCRASSPVLKPHCLHWTAPSTPVDDALFSATCRKNHHIQYEEDALRNIELPDHYTTLLGLDLFTRSVMCRQFSLIAGRYKTEQPK